MCLLAALDAEPLAQSLVVLATAEKLLVDLPAVLVDSLERDIELRTPLAVQRAHFLAPMLQGACAAPADGARSTAVREVLP